MLLVFQNRGERFSGSATGGDLDTIAVILGVGLASRGRPAASADGQEGPPGDESFCPHDRSALVAARDRRRRRLTALHRRLAGLQRAPDRGGLRIRRAGRRAALATAAGVVVAAAFGVTLVAGGLPALEALAGPPPQPRVLPADTLISDAAGNLIADVHEPGVNRLPVPLSQISAYFREAIVAVKDRNFWSEGAVDPLRLAEATWSDLSSGSETPGRAPSPCSWPSSSI